jgi:uncharacterized protein YqeY
MIVKQVDEDLKTAMLARDVLRTGVLRMLKSALKYAATEQSSSELEDTAAAQVVRKQIKQRQDSVQSFSEAGRPELAEKEQLEIAILELYLPQSLSPSQIEELIKDAIRETGATSIRDMGKVMQRANELAAGRVDGKTLSAGVRQHLA